MTIPFTLRRRLLIYTLLLMALLIGFLLFFYQLGRNVILQTADRNTELFAVQVEGRLRSRSIELDRYSRMISENLQLREYMFIVTSISGDTKPLEKLFNHLYGWVPLGRVAFFSHDGKLLLGENLNDSLYLAQLKRRKVTGKPVKTSFYFFDGKRLDIVKVAPMYYQDRFLGNLVISFDIAEDLVNSAMEAKYGQIFVVRNNNIVRSTLASSEGKGFPAVKDTVEIDGLSYRLQPIRQPVEAEKSVTIWFGLSDVDLLESLDRSQELMFSLALVAMLLVLVATYFAFNRFSKPVSRLVELMGKVGEGSLPNVGSVGNDDEIGYLTNQFKDMVSRLRRQQREIDKVHEQLEQQATTDELTGFYNRRFLYNIYPKLWSEANRQRKSLGVILCDLDHFKLVNDTHGHLVGDEMLKIFSGIINQASRVSDFIIRMGGEEFLILTSEGIESAQVLAEKIRSRLERTPMPTETGKIRITCSFGIAQAEISDGQNGLSAVLRRADLALYRAKDSGRNRVATWDETLKRA